MQPSQAKEYFPGVKSAIDHAAQLCQITRDVPDELRDGLSELGRESDQVQQVVETAHNDEHIRQSVTRLEKIGDRVLHACEQAGNDIDREMRDAVRQAHDAIASLEHRLH